MPKPVASFPGLSVLAPLCCAAALAWWGACAEAEGEPPAGKIQSVTLDAVRAPDPLLLLRLRDMGVTHLTLIQFAHQSGYGVPEVRMHNDARWFSESDAGIRILARQADSLGLQIILKPHIWVGQYSVNGQSRETIGFDTEADWEQWEGQYRAFMMHYAHLAEEVGASVLVVGTELANAARSRPAFWRSLIAEVRAVYGGALTYAANWYQEYEDITFWDALDYVGVQAYFELSRDDRPTPAMLRAGWTPPKAALQHLSDSTGRPVLFTEIGYRNVAYAAAQPWRWPARNEDAAVQDDTLQAHLYEAFFESVWHEPWFAGAVLWKWHPDDEGRRRRRALGFSPQNKPAEQVIARWFSRRPAVPAAASPR